MGADRRILKRAATAANNMLSSVATTARNVGSKAVRSPSGIKKAARRAVPLSKYKGIPKKKFRRLEPIRKKEGPREGNKGNFREGNM